MILLKPIIAETRGDWSRRFDEASQRLRPDAADQATGDTARRNDVPGPLRAAGGAVLADARYQLFFCDSGHREALNTLRGALDSGEGFIRVSGEVGTGKTMLCRTFMKGLRDDEQVVYIPNPHLMPTMLRLAVARELGVPADSQLDQNLLLMRIQERLIELARAGKRVIVCLDEAQAMPDETLEALRLLTNLETERSKLLQVVLFGQPELEDKLAKPELRQVRQRIAWSYRLTPYDRDELEAYVEHRLRTAGYRGDPLFTPAALDALDSASGGIPRLINVIGAQGR
ncbi:MAG: AAA family ATPase [Halofilum sp. (in: g-proteobacteria)]|nr:AAA family ATPase [Halofilum sp. (in: g-proteobacteria)]